MRNRSVKRAKQERQYAIDRKKYLEVNNLCGAEIECLVGQSTEVHHMKGRIGDLLLNQEFWLPVCRLCHDWIENHPKEAKEKGLSLSRLSI